MPQQGLADMLLLGVPCLMGVVVLGGAIFQMVKARRWWFAIPALFALCGIANVLAIWIRPELYSELICLGALAVIMIGAFALIVIRQVTQIPVASGADGQPPTPPPDPPPGPPS